MRGLYVHIPFCHNICTYCDFFKRIPKNNHMIDDYLDRLVEDLNQYSSYFNSIETIYIGGGTPSILNESQLEKLLKMLSFFKNIKEYTIEANPESLTKEKILILAKYGVNRVSLGVQSFKNKSLELLGRHHSKNDVLECVNNLKENKIKNINIDLIFAIPNTNLEDVRNDLNMFYSLDLPHLSYYSLIIEDKTIIKHNRVESNELEDVMYEFIMNDLEKHGYKQYEISNYSKNSESIHNKLYWQNKEYIGIGAGASGYLNHVRYQNEHLINEYMINFINNKEIINQDEMLKEEMILGLRMVKGINIDFVNKKYGIDLLKKYMEINDYIKNGYLINDGFLRLTKKGIMFANEVFMIFI